MKILLGCGTAAGFAAAYNVPIGASLFAMEVVLGSFALEIFGPIVVAAVLATLLARAAQSSAPIYAAPGYELVSSWEIVFHFGLGIVGALVAVAFVLAMRGAASLFRRLPLVPEWARPVVGLVLAGGIGLTAPQVLGNGFDTITLALQEGFGLRLLALLALLKLAATALTAGSGCPGGHFTPSLCVGALVGGGYGELVHRWLPESTASSGAYAAVGMAAVAAGCSHAPLSAILMLFEFTGNYDLILPLMIASIVSSLVAKRLYPYSIYTEPLQRRGVELSYRMEEAALAGLAVEDLAREDLETLRPTEPYAAGRRPLSRHPPPAALRGRRGQAARLGLAARHQARAARERDGRRGRGPRPDGAGRPWSRAPPTACTAPPRLFARSDFERLPVIDAEGQLPRRAGQARPARGLRAGGARPAGRALDLRRVGPARLEGQRGRAAARLRAALGAAAPGAGRQDPRRGAADAAAGDPGDRDPARRRGGLGVDRPRRRRPSSRRATSWSSSVRPRASRRWPRGGSTPGASRSMAERAAPAAPRPLPAGRPLRRLPSRRAPRLAALDLPALRARGRRAPVPALPDTAGARLRGIRAGAARRGGGSGTLR